MSNATDLATTCFVFPDSAMGLYVFNEHELEAFYHAARAEALREAVLECKTASEKYSNNAYAGGSITQPASELMAISAAISRLSINILALAENEVME